MQEGVIDIHAHILPGIDDGAADFDESQKMLQLAFEQGIRTIVMTPHFSRHQIPQLLRERTAILQDMASEISSDFHIILGQENIYSSELLEQLHTGLAFTMADSHYVLVEFMPDVSWQILKKAGRDLVNGGYYPIFAHIERYGALQQSERIDELISSGCYMQMNYKSLTGHFWDEQTRWCRRQVKEGRIHLLGTDAHHIKFRRPIICEAMKWLHAKLPGEQVRELTRTNAEHILEDKKIYS